MKPLQELYRYAEQENITVDGFQLTNRAALSLMDEDGRCYVALDREKLTGEALELPEEDHLQKAYHLSTTELSHRGI